jgi:hypothetical protein
MHDLATALACDNISIDLHVTEGTTNDAACKAFRAHRGATLKKMEHSLRNLNLLLPLSTDTSVRSSKLPLIRDISGPDSLPACLGVGEGKIVAIAGDVALARLISAFNDVLAAAAELRHVTADLSRVSGNIDSVISQSTSMLSALCAKVPDLVCGAGSSGVVGGLSDALFEIDLNNLGDHKSEIAAGMASLINEGLELWAEQRQQIGLLQAGMRLLLQRQPDRDYITFNVDRCQRANALRYATMLFSRKLTPAAWAAKSADVLASVVRSHSSPELLQVLQPAKGGGYLVQTKTRVMLLL